MMTINPLYIIIILLGLGFLLPTINSLSKGMRNVFFFLALIATSFIAGDWLYALLYKGVEAGQFFTAGIKPPLSINFQIGLYEAVFITAINILMLLGAIYLYELFNKIGTKAFVLYLLLMLGLNGLVLTRDLFNVFVFMEITAIASYSLIGMELKLESLTAGLKYIFAGSLASVFLLLGIIMFYNFTGNLNIDGIFAANYGANFKIIGLATFFLFFSMLIEMKQFPANGWALDVYESAPSGIAGIISAAGTAGVFFVIYKILPLSKSETWFYTVAGVGLLTFIAMNLMGIREKKSNRILGYSSIAQMGLLLMVMSLGFVLDPEKKIFPFIVLGLFINHFLAKAGLFWLSGIIKKKNYKDWTVLKKNPILLFFFSVFVLGLIGFPPFPGFWSKWSLIVQLASHKMIAWIIIILIGSFFEVVYMGRWLGYAIKGSEEEETIKCSINERLPILIILVIYSALGLFFGFMTGVDIWINFLPVFAAVGMLLLDWLPSKIKGLISIAVTAFYAYKLFPETLSINSFFNILFLAGSIILLITTLNRKGKQIGFYPLLLLLIAALSGLTRSETMLQFFVNWELMTISSYLLIVRGKNSRSDGFKYLLFSIAGAYSIFTGFALSISINHATSLSSLANAGAYSWLVLLLISIGFLIKSGALGFHIWVGGAYGYSEDDFTPFVSSLLSKAGIAGFIFVLMIMGVTKTGLINNVYTLLGWIGVLTAVGGTMLALFSEDVKRLLAYSSIGQVGYILTGIAVMSHLGWAAALWHTVNHFLFKGLLFITIAGVIYRTKTTKMYEMGGLIKKMPLSFFSSMIAIIAVSGVPPLTGFGSKWLLYESMIEKGWYLQTGLAFFASTAAFLYLFRFIHSVFLGQPKDDFKKVKEAPIWYVIPQVILMIGIFTLSFIPKLLLGPISSIVQPFLGNSIEWKGHKVFSSLGYWNAYAVMLIVIGIFIILMVYLLLTNPKVQKVKQFNIVYAAERPETPELTHYAYKFFEPFDRALGFLVTPLVTRFWKLMEEIVDGFAAFFRIIYTGNSQTYSLFILFSGLILFFITVGVKL